MNGQGSSQYKSEIRPRGRIRWRAKSISSSNSHVPARPGVYAIGHSKAHLGLEMCRVYVYVGRTDNLRRRLGEHTPAEERNPGLKRYLLARHDAVCWFAAIDGCKSEVVSIEADLIGAFKPRYNTNLKDLDKGETGNDETS